MSTMASERSWLLNPGLLKLVHQCRRLIQSEFGVKLHLTEDRLEYRLAEYASKTRSSDFIRTWEALKHQIPTLELPAEEEPEGKDADGKKESASPKRMYRGQAIADETKPRTDDTQLESDGEVDSPRKAKKMYRGQVVG
ncbi:hypothetical protein [Marinobacter sp. CHS3-4]|uniref:hypothetical protein n=1 Tax=Marinobacter sp. CHS3-4 TaxID=3045174 RepID=UPI0024B5263A|nr:hypothetical protein [Marinobacter sp. CHS3-4]MDI9246541.1 hypothetical protein [Marinobacter sp. CHS3-4]